MSDFDSLLTRSFAEADQPADNGFSVRVGQAVARREAALRVRAAVQNAGIVAAVAVVGYVGLGLAMNFGQEWLANGGLEVARAVGSLDSGASVVEQAESVGAGLFQSLGLGLTQIMLIAGALAGGAVAYRSTQD